MRDRRAHDVREWAIANGDREDLRIVLCGYEEGMSCSPSWQKVAWKALGGYGSQNASGNGNRHKERLWFSPHCRYSIGASASFDDDT
jgi:hypothetical protein